MTIVTITSLPENLYALFQDKKMTVVSGCYSNSFRATMYSRSEKFKTKFNYVAGQVRNKNGVPDELEKYLQDTYVESANVSKTVQSANLDFLKKSINEGYITVFFYNNSTKPLNSSLDNINYMLTYLKANPNTSIDIIGYSDKIGKSDQNEKLALQRANNVKKSLVKSGIDASRLNAISGGEATSEHQDSNEARSMVRKVIFKIK